MQSQEWRWRRVEVNHSSKPSFGSTQEVQPSNCNQRNKNVYMHDVYNPLLNDFLTGKWLGWIKDTLRFMDMEYLSSWGSVSNPSSCLPVLLSATCCGCKHRDSLHFKNIHCLTGLVLSSATLHLVHWRFQETPCSSKRLCLCSSWPLLLGC